MSNPRGTFPRSPSRRKFLTDSTVALGALSVGFLVPATGIQRALAAAKSESPSATPQWLSLAKDGSFVLTSGKVEMGQGVDTAWAMTVAEELYVPLERIRIARAPVNPFFRGPIIKRQSTYGSTGIEAFFTTLTEAAIAMRTALIDAAAARWQVAATECVVEDGAVLHPSSRRALSYGELAGSLERADPSSPAKPIPKPRPKNETRFLGKPMPRIDSRDKVTGVAKFGIDLVVPGMKTALLIFPPKIGGRVKSINTSAVKIKGFVSAVPTSAGVVVIADGFWPAKQAKEAIKIEWEAPETLHPDSDALEARYRKRISEDGVEVRKVGAVPNGQELTTTSAEYFAPFLAHAAMEPLNCIAALQNGEMHIWTGTQAQETALEAVLAVTRLPKEKIHIHSQLIGGGFGRRAAPDFVRVAAEVAMRVSYPVKLIYERAEDMQSFYYRPASLTRLEASVDRAGLIKHFAVKVVGPALTQHFGGNLSRTANGGEFDFFAVQGLTTPIYAIANRESRYIRDETGIPTWIWRGVGLSQNVHSLECFIDELAHNAGMDPIAFRLANLSAGDAPTTPPTPPATLALAKRARAALMLAREKSQWGRATAADGTKIAQGVAIHAHGGVFLVVVADVSMTDNRPKIHRVTFVCDSGRIVNPNIVRQQMEGGIMMGISMLHSEGITFKDGAVVQSNFHDYPVARISDTPEIECHLIEGTDQVLGMGEFTNTTIAPAVANAMFKLTGKRIRGFPLRA